MFKRSRGRTGTSDGGAAGGVADSQGKSSRRSKNASAFDASGESLDAEIHDWVDGERPTLGSILAGHEFITGDQLLDALTLQRQQGGRIGELLIRLGHLDEHHLAYALAAQFGVPLADLRTETPDPEATAQLPEDLARRYTVVPMYFDHDDNRLYVVTAEPLDSAAIEAITVQCHRIGLMIAAPSDIQSTIESVYSALNSAALHIQAFELVDEEDSATDSVETLAVDENAPIVQVVNRILIQGVRNRASDIHIEPTEHDLRVRYRVDGAMTEAIRLPGRMAAPMSSRIKVLAEMNIVERRRPQDGQFSVTVDGRPIDIRTSVVATIHGEKIVLRLLDKSRSIISLNELGMPADVVEPFLKIVRAPLGMLLCTGPTGSGKTTTLYSTLAQVNDDARNVVTIEDPVEYHFPGVNQMQISEASGITFADGLRGILRQDPDVILVGEIRDTETAQIAMQAALTGHFVLSSLHAVDAVAALHRFTDMGLEPFLVASAVSGVVGQRLLRRICDACKEPYIPPSSQVRLVANELRTNEATFMRGAGCNLCHGSGYLGRIGVYELLTVTDKIRELIVDKATHNVVRKVAIDEGMRTMQVEAFRLVAEGITTVEEVIRSVYAPGVDLDQAPMGALPAPKRSLIAGPMGIPEEAGDGSDDPSGGHEVDLREGPGATILEFGA